VFADDAASPGRPGAQLVEAPAIAPASCTTIDAGFSECLYALPQPVALTAGTYWLAADGVKLRIVPRQGHIVHARTGPDREFTPYDNAGADFVFSLFATPGVSPPAAIRDLQASVAGMGLHQGTANSLDAKLRAATSALAAGDTPGACAALQDVLNFTAAQRDKRIPPAQADQIDADTRAIRAALGCGP
jgi:hypothetical protein